MPSPAIPSNSFYCKLTSTISSHIRLHTNHFKSPSVRKNTAGIARFPMDYPGRTLTAVFVFFALIRFYSMLCGFIRLDPTFFAVYRADLRRSTRVKSHG